MYRKFAIAVLIVAPILVAVVQNVVPAARPPIQDAAPPVSDNSGAATPSTLMAPPTQPFVQSTPPPDPASFAKPLPGAGQPMTPTSTEPTRVEPGQARPHVRGPTWSSNPTEATAAG